MIVFMWDYLSLFLVWMLASLIKKHIFANAIKKRYDVKTKDILRGGAVGSSLGS